MEVPVTKYQRYNASEKGRARKARYDVSLKGITSRFKRDNRGNTKRRGA